MQEISITTDPIPDFLVGFETSRPELKLLRNILYTEVGLVGSLDVFMQNSTSTNKNSKSLSTWFFA